MLGCLLFPFLLLAGVGLVAVGVAIAPVPGLLYLGAFVVLSLGCRHRAD